MGKKAKTKKVGRDAKTGKFIPVKEAEKRRATAVVETIKIRNKKKWIKLNGKEERSI